MQSLKRALASVPHISLIALALQSIVFGLVHMYQGPVGIIGAGVAGLIFGALVLAARGSIWPAVLAHGISNSISLIQLYSPS
jgi:membrane protease YdiL (CAAX protease family)